MSFINDIQTVQELQDEETLTHNDTVIRNISPQPIDEEIKIEDHYSSDQSDQESVIINESKNIKQITLEETLNNAVENVKSNSNNDSDISNIHESDKKSFLTMFKYENNLKLSFKFSGRSFGSKAFSRKVSPKMSSIDDEDGKLIEYMHNSIRMQNDEILRAKFNNKVRLSERSLSNEDREAQKHFENIPKEIIIENLNSFSSKSSDIDDSEPVNYLNTMSSNMFKDSSNIMLHTESDEILMPKRNFDINVLHRNSTTKELLHMQPRQKREHNQSNTIRMIKKKSRKRKQRFRDLSKVNQVIYKGTKGFHLIKKYRNKRRHESRQNRQLSLGAMGSVRSRNKSTDGFFSTLRSCSSDVNSVNSRQKEKSMKRGQVGGLFTRNKLNAKYKEITQAKKQRVQKSLSKVMRLHAGHAEFSNSISRHSSNTPCESMVISPHQNNEV